MNTQSIQELLQRFPMFKDLTDFEMEPIINLAKNRIYRSGTHIFMQGDPLTNVYFIHKGLVKIYKTDIHGKEQIVNMLQPGDMFPHQGFFRQDDYPAHAEVTEDAVLIYIPIHSFENFLITHPEICIKLFRVLGDKIVDLQNRLQEKILHNTYEQIILLLLRLAKNHGREVSDTHTVIDTQFTNREMANMIGSSRETVSRTLTQLKKKDFIQTDKTGLLQINTEALEDELF
ncbi:Crp/Fnr family transcriptional regulator [Virgibacillus halodenitrificans]|nr:Crp/Fnr family transcriptional regulator [Virgibacillus halodenitrificans]MCJ0932319.1 Crp/Fnr family transcriptional regulator [Virgibacillus halodenitrificans]MEC2158631.1 Crp/Fnr family transcriptional regulator [Virgibacillus halodenitrificans]WHX24686.1 Crp/Fnr family transcriptional regulator [Virgibacillus halodenitrificans]CDQ32311.1 Anaerobic regulatory protein [Virgibacillus halodenitrificans]